MCVWCKFSAEKPPPRGDEEERRVRVFEYVFAKLPKALHARAFLKARIATIVVD